MSYKVQILKAKYADRKPKEKIIKIKWKFIYFIKEMI